MSEGGNLIMSVEKINALKSAIERAKTERTKAETNLETYNKQLQEVENEIRALDVEPGNIDAVIAELDQEIAKDLAEVEALIPAQYRGVGA
jgi:chromosome segregation ATPase